MEHHEYSPSSYPMWDKCIHFETNQDGMGEGSPAHRGTLQHTALEKIMKSPDANFDSISKEDAQWVLDTLDDQEIANVIFASDRINVILDRYSNEYDELFIEKKLVFFSTEMVSAFGTGDYLFVTDDNVVVIDYKSGNERDYDPQLKGYALGAMQETGKGKAKVIVVYGRGRTSTESDYSLVDCQIFFDDMIDKLQNKDKYEACPNNYCDWCAKKTDCVSRKKSVFQVKKMVTGGKDLLYKLSAKSDLSKLTPERLGKLMHFSNIVTAWASDLKKMIELKLEEDEESVEGWTLKSGPTKSSIDYHSAYSIAVQKKFVDPNDFLKVSTIAKGKLMKLVYGDESAKKESKEDFGIEFKDAIIPGNAPKPSLIVDKTVKEV